MVIKSGELLTGTLCKKSLGAVAGGLVHVTWMQYGPDETRKFLNNCQYATNYWLLHNGMSIGVGDTVADEGTMLSIESIIVKAKQDVSGRHATEWRALCGWFCRCCRAQLLCACAGTSAVSM